MRVLELTGPAQLDTLAAQVDAGVATEPCSCPCPTVSLAVDQRRARPIDHPGRLELQVDYDAGGIMVWVDDGWLSNLEIYWWSDEPPREFPPLDALRAASPD
jgi:hypothetical protein